MADHFEKLQKSELHVTGAANGCLWRSCGRTGHQYRVNGKDYLEAHKGALKRYYDHDFTSTTSRARKRADKLLGSRFYDNSRRRDPRYVASLWHIGQRGNFGSGKKPWVNNAHHILPCAVLRNAFASGNEYEILLEGKYNLNAGENIVWLPKKSLDGQMMQMVTHPGSHPQYNDRVEALVNSKIKPKIRKATDRTSKGHGPLRKKDVPKLKKVIDAETEKIMMNTLKYGKIGAGVSVNQFDPAWTQK